MTKDPSGKLSKVFVLIPVIQIQVSKWEIIIVCRSRTPGGMRTVTTRILPQLELEVIQFHFGEWELGSSGSLSIQETRRSVDISVSFNSPEFNGTSANGM